MGKSKSLSTILAMFDEDDDLRVMAYNVGFQRDNRKDFDILYSKAKTDKDILLCSCDSSFTTGESEEDLVNREDSINSLTDAEATLLANHLYSAYPDMYANAHENDEDEDN
ncbi:hypothetical protein MKY96_33045 [Paenibacillus sp. FSL R7-0302]|uniref:hypothetical protein n=1 Tax=Paenibacillus sp. FSL R7-0302 TaxID=2921681 RepID=UPI0030F9B860